MTESKDYKSGMPYRYFMLHALCTLALCLAQLATFPAQADSRRGEHELHDEDRARRALERREILPLDRIVARVRETVPGGEISSLELENDKGTWVYEFKVISTNGRMVEVYIDAKSGQLIEKPEE